MKSESVEQSLARTLDPLRQRLNTAIRGKAAEIEQLLIAIVAGGSVLIQDVPGVGKTTLAKTLAASLDLRFRRIQSTPDLLPSDILGGAVFEPQTSTFRLRRGPIFANLLLVDEINRASPRTQSALLEAMAEQQVSLDWRRYRLPRPFLVIATQNPWGSQGTFPLPESQLDRFMIQMSLDYPDRHHEVELLFDTSPMESQEISSLTPLLTLLEVRQLQASVQQVRVDRRVAAYLVDIVQATRKEPRVKLGCSTRATRMLFRISQAAALLSERSYVLPDDVQRMAPLVLSHRLILQRSVSATPHATSDIVNDILSSLPIPT